VGVPVTVTTSLRLTVNFTTLPAPKIASPGRDPGARRHHRRHGPHGGVDGVDLRAGLRQAIQQQVGGIPPLSCTVAPLRLIAVAASNAVFCPTPTWYLKVSCGLPCDSFSFD